MAFYRSDLFDQEIPIEYELYIDKEYLLEQESLKERECYYPYDVELDNEEIQEYKEKMQKRKKITIRNAMRTKKERIFYCVFCNA